VNVPLGGPEPQVRDVAAALLRLAAPDRRAAIGALIALIERVVAGEEPQRSDRGTTPDPARASPRRIGRVTRGRRLPRESERRVGVNARRVQDARTLTENSLDSSAHGTP
jgi:hypothetical protein